MAAQLTTGAVAAVSEHADGNGTLQPVLQVVDVRIVPNVKSATNLLLCQIQDHTGVTYATAFQAAGEAIFGHTAQELFMIQNVEQDDMRFTEIMQAVLRREYLFKLKIYEETYNGEQRVICSIIGVEKLEETNNLLKDVSRPILKDHSSYIPSVGSANLEAKQSLLTSSNAYGCATVVGDTGFAQSDGIWSAGRGAQACFKCNQPGHWSKDCLV
uniref:Putative replication protein n=1 Tax=Sorghum bicolor TaxID=4558 RepID=B3VTC9_SORBI|nr:putative replication protein [Sorghum bicolor]